MMTRKMLSLASSALLIWSTAIAPSFAADPITRDDLYGTWRDTAKDKKDRKIVVISEDSTGVRRCNKSKYSAAIDDIGFHEQFEKAGQQKDLAWKGISYNTASAALLLVQCPDASEVPDKDKTNNNDVPDWAKEYVTSDQAEPALEYDLAMTIARGYSVLGHQCNLTMQGKGRYGSFEVKGGIASTDIALGPPKDTDTYELVRYHMPALATPLKVEWAFGGEPAEQADQIMNTVRSSLAATTAVDLTKELLATIVEGVISSLMGLPEGEMGAAALPAGGKVTKAIKAISETRIAGFAKLLTVAVGEKIVEKIAGNLVRGKRASSATEVGQILTESFIKVIMRNASPELRAAIEKTTGTFLGISGVADRAKAIVDQKLSESERESLTKWMQCRFAYVEIPASSKLDVPGITGGYAIVDTVMGQANVWLGVQPKGGEPHVLEGEVGGLPEDSVKYWPLDRVLRMRVLM